tara:strand:- start:3601 stop:4089 length:489 start_codon:yes stop_codon:yes gene_type:complete
MNPNLVHKHLLVRAEVNSPPLANHGEDKLNQQIKDLVKKINMNLLSGPHSAWGDHEGNEGWSAVAIIDTSSITFHSWTDGVIQLDVYSCKEFAIKNVWDWLSQFDIEKLDYKFINRDKGFKTIDDNSFSWWDSKYYNTKNKITETYEDKIERLKAKDPFIYK